MILISGLTARAKKQFFKIVRKLPYVRGRIAREIESSLKGLEDGFSKDVGTLKYVHKLPLKGLTVVSLLLYDIFSF